MAPVKATAPHRARYTTSRSRSQKPMPPKGRWRPLESRSALSSIGAEGRHHHPGSPCPHRLLSLCRPTYASAFTRTIRPLFQGRHATTAVVRMWSPGIGHRAGANWKCSRPLAPRLFRSHPALCQPNRQERSRHRRAQTSSRQIPSEIRRLTALPRLRTATGDPHHLRFAQPRALGLKVSDEFTVPLCRGHHRQLHQAGNEVAWWDNLNIKPLRSPKRFGIRPTQNLRLPIPRCRPLPMSKVEDGAVAVL